MAKKILVVTHCQTYGIANSLSFLLPQYSVEGYDLNIYQAKLEKGDLPRETVVDTLVIGPQSLKKGGGTVLDDSVTYDRLAVVPGMQIDRYHPDVCWIPHDGKLLWGPIGQNQSRIIFRGFQKGYPARRIRELFNAEIFRKAGYLTYRTGQVDNLVTRFAEFGLDISGYFAKWSRNGSFMHTLNHPKVEVLFDISREVVRKLGLPSLLDDTPEIGCAIEDNLAIGAVYPVYPEIATAYGFRGHYYFKKPHSYRMLSLDEFIEQSLAAYEEAGARAPLEGVDFYTPHYSDAALAEII